MRVQLQRTFLFVILKSTVSGFKSERISETYPHFAPPWYLAIHIVQPLLVLLGVFVVLLQNLGLEFVEIAAFVLVHKGCLELVDVLLGLLLVEVLALGARLADRVNFHLFRVALIRTRYIVLVAEGACGLLVVLGATIALAPHPADGDVLAFGGDHVSQPIAAVSGG